MPNRVPSDVADARKDNIISIQQTISKKKNQLYVGKKVKVLVEKIGENKELIGRSYNFAPEIDGNVIYLLKIMKMKKVISVNLLKQIFVLRMNMIYMERL